MEASERALVGVIRHSGHGPWTSGRIESRHFCGARGQDGSIRVCVRPLRTSAYDLLLTPHLLARALGLGSP
eukprot:scaffold224629_cov24-Tisochrysis_lutea.AAC.1